MGGVLARILYALLLAGILGVAAWISFSRFVLGKAEEVPDLTGRSVDEATALAAERGLRVVVDRSQEAFDEEIPAHRIRGQSPAAGMAVKAGQDLRVFLSLGPEIVRSPDLAGLTARTAALALAREGLDGGGRLCRSGCPGRRASWRRVSSRGRRPTPIPLSTSS